MTRLDALRIIVAEAASGKIHVAGHAETLLRIRRELDNPDCAIANAAKLIQAEPVLAAQVVAIANSVSYNPSGREVTDIKTAVTRLGFATLRSLAMAQVTRQMAGAPGTPEQRRMTVQLWQHTAHVAALCRVIARRVTHQDPDTALFVGLVHEVGEFYQLSRAGEYPILLDMTPPTIEELAPMAPDDALAMVIDPDDVDDEESRLEGELGRAVLHKLAVPEGVIGAVTDYWAGFLAMPPKSLGDTLLLADSLAPVASPLRPVGGQATIDFTLGDDTLAEILAESAEEVASVTRALNN